MNGKNVVNGGAEETEGAVYTVREFMKIMKYRLLAGDRNAKIRLNTVSVNRPGLILSGFNDYFAKNRIQVLGNAEMAYLYQLADRDRVDALTRLCRTEVPCIIVCRNLEPCRDMLRLAEEYNIPVFRAANITSEVENDLINFLNDVLAPVTTKHGTLLDIDGTGVFLSGISGVGKSETALELIHRGHMLVADDAVLMKRVKDTIVGTSPEKIRDFIELRGVGIIDVGKMYGVAGVLGRTNVDLVIELVQYDKPGDFDRTDSTPETYVILGVPVPKLTIPVIMGRNLAIIVEVAAKNFRLRQSGCDAVRELEKRMRR